MPEHVTISDIAREAGVSIKTVSRVLNRQSGVAKATRDKIDEIIRSYNFKPNSAARALSGQQAYDICLLFPNMVNHYYVTALQIGAQKACMTAGFHLGVEVLEDLISVNPGFDLTDFVKRRYAGIILPPVVGDRVDVLTAIEAAGLPYVRIAPTVELNRSPRVYIRDEQAAYDMMAHLWNSGHREIAFIASKGYPATFRRLKGYQRFFDDHGIIPKSQWQIEIPNYSASFAAADKLLSSKHRPTAIFASTDLIAAHVMAAASKNGLVVPEDLSVTGFDDSPLSQIVWPPLTTIRQPAESMAHRAVRLLLEKLGGEMPESNLCMAYELVVRQSVRAL